MPKAAEGHARGVMEQPGSCATVGAQLLEAVQPAASHLAPHWAATTAQGSGAERGLGGSQHAALASTERATTHVVPWDLSRSSCVPVRTRPSTGRQVRGLPGGGSLGRTAGAAAAAVVLCCAATLFVGAGRRGADGTSSVALAMVESNAARGRNPNALTGQALSDVRQMYQQNPELVKEFALLTGSTGQRLLSEVDGAKTTAPAAPQAFKGPSLHTLDKYMQQMTSMTEEQVHGPSGREERYSSADGTPSNLAWKALGTTEVNKRTAWMMVRDLSSDWDKNSNYSATPWEFCAGRNLSPRQIRECTGHLIRVAGVHSHRDLNMNAKIYDRAHPPYPHSTFATTTHATSMETPDAPPYLLSPHSAAHTAQPARCVPALPRAGVGASRMHGRRGAGSAVRLE